MHSWTKARVMKRGEYHEKLKQWEAEGYDVSEFKQKWFPEGNGRGRSRAWMPRVAGILDLVGGVVVLYELTIRFGGIWRTPFFGVLVGILGWSVFIMLGAVPIVGGIFAIKRRNWRLSLTAAICVLAAGFMNVDMQYVLILWILGVAAATVTVRGRDRFK
ncbi:MAG: hypothetical protein WBH01_05860 [Dehalococcoidia bacterium]